jgi:[acyl-carrier-protein] S-malonyltransferase
MPTTAIVFPGQGSQTPEMRDDVQRTRPDLLALACEIVGEDPFLRVDEGTGFAQPAIFCAGLAGLTWGGVVEWGGGAIGA